jgi:leucyl-tRNA synthetase
VFDFQLFTILQINDNINAMINKYDPKKIESKWQKEWLKKKTFEVKNTGKGKKKMVLVEFPYPSGAGLHMGHMRPFIAGDVTAKYFKMNGFNTMYPMGWDAFGLPAENYAIKNKVHPRVSTAKNVANAKKQLLSWGTGYDWSREVNTTDPEYYKWTQKLFLEFYDAGLAYEKFGEINWCPKDKTGLANEEVVDGKCDRCGTEVEKKNLRQWYLKITDYAEKLLEGLKDLKEWPEPIKLQQENWIGKSEGSEIEFKLRSLEAEKLSTSVKVFTTRVDTLFGVTYLVLAPEHELVQKLKSQIENWSDVEKYINDCKNKSDIDRTAESKEKTGVVLNGIYAINPANNEQVPVWIADYVLASYGTGAVMAVPAHDERDFEFAKKYNLPIKSVVAEVVGDKNPDSIERNRVCAIIESDGKVLLEKINPASTKYPGDYILVGGGIESGESPDEALGRELFEELGIKNFDVMSKLRVYRFNFFSERLKKFRTQLHFPYFIEINKDEIVENKNEAELIWVDINEAISNFTLWGNTDQAKILLKYKFYDSEFFSGEGELFDSGSFTGLTSEEARKKITEFVGGRIVTKYKLRDWVFSRQRYWGEPIPLIHCPKCGIVPVPEKDLPVKLPEVKNYEPTGTGESPLAGIDKWVNVKCPKCKGKAKRETNTMPQWAGSSWYWLRYMDPKNKKTFSDKKIQKYWSPVDLYFGGMEHTTLHLLYSRFWNLFFYDRGIVTVKEPYKKRVPHGIILGPDGEKMSKSRGNVVNPDDVIKIYGADTTRLYMMFLGPHGAQVSWNDKGIVGTRRFLERVFAMREMISKKENNDVTITLHKTIKKVTEDIETFSFNTAVSTMMIFVNTVYESKEITKKSFETFLHLLAPFAPHLVEELWNGMGNKKSIYESKWPKYKEELIKAEKVTVVVQVNGKIKAELSLDRDLDDKISEQIALDNEKVMEFVGSQEIKRVIVVKNRLINIVI